MNNKWRVGEINMNNEIDTYNKITLEEVIASICRKQEKEKQAKSLNDK